MQINIPLLNLPQNQMQAKDTAQTKIKALQLNMKLMSTGTHELARSIPSSTLPAGPSSPSTRSH